MTTMSIYKSNDESMPTDTKAYYETVASQKEIYLEEREEELPAILLFDNPSPSESVDKQLDDAAEELITGDSDDPPLSEEAVAEMLRMTQMPKGLGAGYMRCELTVGGVTLGSPRPVSGFFRKKLPVDVITAVAVYQRAAEVHKGHWR